MSYDDSKALLISAFNAAPPYIQNVITSGKFASFMERLRARLNIHVDIADEVSNEITLTLLGIAEPKDLPDNLRKEAKVPEDLIQPIIDEVNRSIFIPLREEVRNNPDALKTPAPPKPAGPPKQQWVEVRAPQKPLSPTQPLAQAPVYTPQAQRPSVSALSQESVTSSFVAQAPANIVLPGTEPRAQVPPPPAPTQQPVLPPQPVARPMPVAPPAPRQPVYTPPVQVVQQPAPEPTPTPVPESIAVPPPSKPVAVDTSAVLMRTMNSDMAAVKRGEEAVPYSAPAPKVLQQAPVAPPTISPPPQTPPVLQPSAQTGYTRPYIPQTPRVAPRPASPPRSGDPYREPIE